jgi:hypothetical protein
MPFRITRHACTSVVLLFAMLAMAFVAHGKDADKKLSTYSAITVDPVIVGPAAAKNFPVGLDAAIRARMVDELRKKKLFQDVQDQAAPAHQRQATRNPPGPNSDPAISTGPSPTSAQDTSQPVEPPRIILSTTVEQFSKGNMAARAIIGFGAGESKITLRFVLRDAATGAELLQFEQKASYTGDLSFTGGTPSEAARGAANGAVKGLIKEIQKNR